MQNIAICNSKTFAKINHSSMFFVLSFYFLIILMSIRINQKIPIIYLLLVYYCFLKSESGYHIFQGLFIFTFYNFKKKSYYDDRTLKRNLQIGNGRGKKTANGAEEHGNYVFDIDLIVPSNHLCVIKKTFCACMWKTSITSHAAVKLYKTSTMQ